MCIIYFFLGIHNFCIFKPIHQPFHLVISFRSSNLIFSKKSYKNIQKINNSYGFGREIFSSKSLEYSIDSRFKLTVSRL